MKYVLLRVCSETNLFKSRTRNANLFWTKGRVATISVYMGFETLHGEVSIFGLR